MLKKAYLLIKSLTYIEIFLSPVAILSAQNLALNKSTASSSVYKKVPGLVPGPNLLVDGNANPTLSMGHCYHGGDPGGGPNWVVVDLQGSFYVDYVYVFARNGNADRLDYFIVGLTSINYLAPASNILRGSYAMCGQYKYKTVVSARHTLKCNANLVPAYRYVIFQQPATGPGLFTICELEVYAVTNLNAKIWKRYYNNRLIGNSFKVITVNDRMRCMIKCLPGECYSVNFRQNKSTCELNKHVNGYALSSLNISLEWDFYEVQYA
ncbi:hypothetical protein HELRODRAFT_176891 [Helobdella robusta]|uniref:Apple domain-containing protein n=1 Tax=Helobdella robusta TaxID=6412 RepID=T1FB09_HELRO|nr:hypothetical protein HELRODRAFT_176891 [Helobdella robusta]ESN98424.1 hypothetical protein HELRODRAFT_176891 [Helobdella robusta]